MYRPHGFARRRRKKEELDFDSLFFSLSRLLSGPN